MICLISKKNKKFGFTHTLLDKGYEFTHTTKFANLVCGFSLLELILAVAIFSLGSIAMATLLIDSNISSKLSLERTEALLYAKEGIESVRSIRNSGWLNLTDGSYGLVNDGSTWFFSGASDLIDDKYTRVVNVQTVSTSTKSVSITVEWDLTPVRTSSVVLNTIFTNWVNPSASLIPTNGLVSYWSFDDALSGTVIDSGPGGNDGTVFGPTATTGVKSLPGTAYSFDGTSNFIDAGSDASLSPTEAITVGAWVKITGAPGSGRMIIAKGGDIEQYAISLSAANKFRPHLKVAACPGGVTCYGTGWIYPDGSMTPAIDTWYYVVETYDGSTLSLYVDGALDSSWVINQSIDYVSTANSLRIGNLQGVGYYFAGAIDQIRIYSRALSAIEVTNIYNEEKP